jgi:hypothetical protein
MGTSMSNDKSIDPLTPVALFIEDNLPAGTDILLKNRSIIEAGIAIGRLSEIDPMRQRGQYETTRSNALQFLKTSSRLYDPHQDDGGSVWLELNSLINGAASHLRESKKNLYQSPPI